MKKYTDHPLRVWMRAHPEFSPTRDTRKVFGVWHSFFYRVLSGHARPAPDRARAWSRITGIPLESLLFPATLNNHKNRHTTKVRGSAA